MVSQVVEADQWTARTENQMLALTDLLEPHPDAAKNAAELRRLSAQWRTSFRAWLITDESAGEGSPPDRGLRLTCDWAALDLPPGPLEELDVSGLDHFTEIVGITEVRALEERYRAPAS